MLRVELLPARMGDCIWIEYGIDDEPYRLVIDGGTSGCYEDMCRRLEGHVGPAIQLIVVTHIDNDHIAGILKYLEQPEHPAEVHEVWFNGFCHLPESRVEELGPVQGERLTTRLRHPDLADRWNARFGGSAVAAPAAGKLPTKEIPGGMKLTVLAPGPDQLSALRPKWKPIINAANLNPAEPKEEKIELPSTVEALGAFVPPDVEKLAGEAFDAEAKEANGSSIVLLAEYRGKRMLFTGDAQPAVLLPAFDRLVGKDQPVEVDLFQAPHHGSKGNVSSKLIGRVRSPRFLFSSNGPKSYGHPNKQAVARVLLHGGPQRKTLYFNYKQRYNEIWGDERLDDHRKKYNYVAKYPEGSEDGIVVDGL